jgi:hypothetical protein
MLAKRSNVQAPTASLFEKQYSMILRFSSSNLSALLMPELE